MQLRAAGNNECVNIVQGNDRLQHWRWDFDRGRCQMLNRFLDGGRQTRVLSERILKEEKYSVGKEGRATQRWPSAGLSCLAARSCHGIIGEKTYMGANSPLSGALKELAMASERAGREKIGGRVKSRSRENEVQGSCAWKDVESTDAGRRAPFQKNT